MLTGLKRSCNYLIPDGKCWINKKPLEPCTRCGNLFPPRSFHFVSNVEVTSLELPFTSLSSRGLKQVRAAPVSWMECIAVCTSFHDSGLPINCLVYAGFFVCMRASQCECVCVHERESLPKEGKRNKYCVHICCLQNALAVCRHLCFRYIVWYGSSYSHHISSSQHINCISINSY